MNGNKFCLICTNNYYSKSNLTGCVLDCNLDPGFFY